MRLKSPKAETVLSEPTSTLAENVVSVIAFTVDVRLPTSVTIPISAPDSVVTLSPVSISELEEPMSMVKVLDQLDALQEIIAASLNL